MPAFQAINLEPEENVDDQIDTTKELHVDEALKRFQHALRLHAQGPAFREAASTAYDELFESEIFKFREARTEYERAERQISGQADRVALEAFSGGLDVDAGGADGVAASLALALYLSYKNHGQFFLDKLKDVITADPSWKSQHAKLIRDDDVGMILERWTAALDQDPSDPEAWRRFARFAASLNSARIKRYCLEAAVELDDDPTVTDVEPPSLAEGLAGEQLKDQLTLLDDAVASSHPAMKPWTEQDMPALLRRFIDPLPFLPDPTTALTPPPTPPEGPDGKEDDTMLENEVPGEITSWAELGVELIKSLDDTKRALAVCTALPVSQMAEQAVDRKMSDDTAVVEESTVTTVPLNDQPKAAGKDSKDSEGTTKPDAAGKASSNRKRSQSAAGLPDGAEEDNGAEKRSKRVRRRDTAVMEETVDPNKAIATQLLPYQDADHSLFSLTKNLVESVGVEDTDTISRLQELLDLSSAEHRTEKLSNLASQDLRHVLTSFKAETASVLINKNEQPTLGLSSFLDHAKSGSDDTSTTPAFEDTQDLDHFSQTIKQGQSWLRSDDIAFEWVRSMAATYSSLKWSEPTKVAVVQMLNRLDSILHDRINDHLRTHADSTERLRELDEIIPMLFELYLDIYERITNPNSVVDYATRMETKYRLARWLDVNSTYLSLLDCEETDNLCVRFMWASVLASSLSDKPVREHILLMWTSLRDFMTEHEVDAISLPNNVVMPKISAAAADREISKLTTMDFFLGLFQEEMEDPVHVIDTLEPVLNPSSVYVSSSAADDSPEPDSRSSDDGSESEKQLISDCAPQGLRDLWKFLQNSSTELRLFLWSRLGDAYAAIDYKTKRLLCHLKSIEMVINDLDAETYINTPEESRRLLFMRMLRSLEDLLMWSLQIALNDKTAFDIIDEDDMKAASCAIAKTSCLLHVASLCEDEIKVGLASAPLKDSTYQAFIGKLRDMQIRAWCLQYTLLRITIPQQTSLLEPQKELADYLAVVHQAVGVRKFCKSSNKVFLKLMRMEILKSKQIENWEDYLEQVLYDLYGLKLRSTEVQEHDCPVEPLDQRQTMQLADRITVLAKRSSMKDLLKSELKNTIEYMQQTLGSTKSTPQMIHNLRNYNEYLKRPINPLNLYKALQGEVQLDSVSVSTTEARLAQHGWYFLLGMIALTRFAGVDLNRRQTPGATDDLRIGATFLRLQLQFTPEKWDAWFRLAECFDYELDEAVLWTADKINKDRDELVKFQRNAIHCYTLALSHSRDQDIDLHDGDPLHDLYYKFGMRLYSSSREPFKMEPFEHANQPRFGINETELDTFKRPVHEEMSKYKVWKFAARLFSMALQRKPDSWRNSYMLAKCYWKMHQTPVEQLDTKDKKTRISAATVLDALKKSVQAAHKARRFRITDPIMEPHYKIAAVLHKMVLRRGITAKEAAAILAEQPLGIKISEDDSFSSFADDKDWQEYIVKNFAKLREKDKSNWQHRIISRHATTLFDGESDADRLSGAKTAFGVLKESMFTKTMVMNVWKCDAERPGRHHVYTSKYTLFMTKLLSIMDDRVDLEMLLRRLRKKGADFYHFTDLWEECCSAYVRLLRDHHEVSSAEDPFKSMSHEEFDILSDRIGDWAAGEGPPNPVFVCLKEATELKKLNGGLMKSQLFDDFINDSYSKLFAEIASTLPGPPPSKIIEERNTAKELAARLEADTASQTEVQKDPKAASALNSLLSGAAAEDSAAGTATPMDVDRSEAAPRARKVAGVRRPDILRKAEFAVSRSMEPVKSVLTKSRVGSVSSKRGSITPAVPASRAASDEEEEEEEGPEGQIQREAAEDRDIDMGEAHDEEEEGEGEEEEEEEGDEGEEEGDEEEEEEDEAEEGEDMDADVSRHRHLLDSGDESDLSDLPDEYDDEEVPEGLLFPHLMDDRDVDGENSGEEADSESEGDEIEEGDEETAELDDDEEMEG